MHSNLDEINSNKNFQELSQSYTVLFNLSSLSSSPKLPKNLSESTIDSTTVSSYDPYQHLTETIVYKYICLTIFIIGIIGNLLSVLVFSRPSLRHRSCAIYFLALAITDIASLCASFIDTVLPSFNNVTLTVKSLFICKLNPLMVYFTTDLSNFLLAAASIDRAVSIQCPLNSNKFCRARIAILIIIGMSIAMILINGHISWGFDILEVLPSVWACVSSKEKYLFSKIRYDRFYAIFDALDMLFAVVIPFIVMLICNIIILIRVLTSRRSIRSIIKTTMRSKKSRKKHEKEKQLTVMLLGSAAAFLVFTLPTEINDTIRAFRPNPVTQTKGAMALMTAIFIAMGQFNHAIHFYIYTLTGGVFRKELIQLFSFKQNKSLSNRNNKTEVTLLQSKQNLHQQIDVHGF